MNGKKKKKTSSPEFTSWKCCNIDFTESHRYCLCFFIATPQTRYRTKAAHAENLRPEKKYQEIVKLEQNRWDSKLPTTQGEVKNV